MSLIKEIPEHFWGLFRSCNREIYMEALLRINEEYEYSNYYLSREVCIQTLNECFALRGIGLKQDELEEELDLLEPAATRVLNWLLKTGWLRKVEDFSAGTANIVIPDYAAVMIEAMEKLTSEETDETQIYIQNVYAILFSLKNDARANAGLLDTALVNTRRLNKALQDMLHNMDKFFGSLLERQAYGELLRDHLEGYVEEVVRRKYHILKTTDNFYIYKADIKRWIGAMREDSAWISGLCARSVRPARPGSDAVKGLTEADVVEKLDIIEKGFDDIEHRIANMDKEHSKYVRATVSRLNYLLNEDDDMKGLVIQLLNRLSAGAQREAMITAVGAGMNLSQVDILSDQSLYKKRKKKADFQDSLQEEEAAKELSREEILDLNKIRKRYSRKQIEEFIDSRMTDGMLAVTAETVRGEEDFEKLILAYDYSVQKKSRFQVLEAGEEPDMVENGGYRYPKLTFIRRHS